jgi:hypothetical protein
MIEAYRVGVNLALSGTIAADIGKVASQFEALNAVIRSSQQHVNELVSGMRGLSRVGRAAADAWKDAASAMERAARAARTAGGSMGMPGAGAGSPPAGRGGGLGPAMAAASIMRMVSGCPDGYSAWRGRGHAAAQLSCRASNAIAR